MEWTKVIRNKKSNNNLHTCKHLKQAWHSTKVKSWIPKRLFIYLHLFRIEIIILEVQFHFLYFISFGKWNYSSKHTKYTAKVSVTCHTFRNVGTHIEVYNSTQLTRNRGNSTLEGLILFLVTTNLSWSCIFAANPK